MSSDFWRVDEVMTDAIMAGAFSGVVYHVTVEGRTLALEAKGHAQLAPATHPMARDTVFDLASVTKTVTAATLAMKLYERGEIHLDQLVADFIPDIPTSKRQITIRHLLCHTSGLPCVSVPGITAMTVGHDKRKVLFETLFGLPLRFSPGTGIEYTCLNYLVLTLVIERITGRTFEALCRDWIFDPLTMDSTCFNPPPAIAERAAATSECRWRKRMLVGEVQDTHALAMGGASGNAGLFSTAPDLTRYCQMIAGRGELDGVRVLQPETVELMTSEHVTHLGGGRGLGWDTPSPDWWAGTKLSAHSCGKTGWTGTSIAVDLERRMTIVILTNRHHADSTENKIASLRPVLHNTIVGAVDSVLARA